MEPPCVGAGGAIVPPDARSIGRGRREAPEGPAYM
jgi:hypothetical protein